MKDTIAFLGCCVAAVLVTLPAAAAEQAQARMLNVMGDVLGTVELVQTANGVLLKGQLKPLPKGEHAFHVHAIGRCDVAASFDSAGGHFALDHKHGFKVAGGPHPGDMANLHVPDSEVLTLEAINPGISLEKGARTSVFDVDGSVLVIHANADDYETQPTGNAGGRIACGVIEAR